MPFKIIWDEKAYDELNNFEFIVSKRILKKVKELSENPFSKDIKRLVGQEGYRLRVGDYRVIFKIDRDTILILKVGHRKNIYY